MPFSDMLDRSCAYYMAIGVPYDVFWNGDYTSLKFYYEAYNLMLEERNREMWLQGFYVFDAVSVALANAFKDKGKPPEKYMEEPLRITEMTELEKEQEQEKILEKFKNQLKALTGRLDRREKHRKEEAIMKEKVEAMIHGSRKPDI